MRKTKRSAFTIVELVIVIAVIAVLSAVLIPTFGSIIESANKAVDTQLVAQINTILAVEDILSGGINEVVDVQQAIKKHGLKLETKSKGAYLWYDRDNGKVVLGSLDENNNLEILAGGTSTNTTAEVDSDGPALLSSTTAQVDYRKGKFDTNMTTLEGFIHGYYFISEESSDGFAEKICAIRSAENADGLRAALTAVTEINASVGQQFTVFMNTHPLITNTSVVYLGTDKSVANAAIVGSNVTEITAGVVTALAEYPNIDYVDLHPNVTKVDSSIGGLKDKIDFFHSSLDVDKFCDDNGITNVYLKGERDKFIQTIKLVHIGTDGETLEGWTSSTLELNKNKWKIALTPWLDSQIAGTATEVYDFIGYSFEKDGSASISLGTSNHFLTEAEKIKVDEGVITIYAIYDFTTPDFKITVGEDDSQTVTYYGSRAVTYMLYAKAITSGTIAVCSNDAVLDASFIGLANATLTLPKDVELLLPYAEDYAKKAWTINQIADATDTNGTTYNQSSAKYNASNYVKDAVYDKTTMTGFTNLTVAGNVKLNVASGADIYVDAECYNYKTATQCYITNRCGVMVLEAGSEIISSGNITAYGIIRGDGTITTNGGTVTELMTLYDWYGGTNASQAVQYHKVVPFNKWKIESILVEKVTINHPTQYRTKGGITVSVVGDVGIDDFVLAGPADSEPIFATETGSVIERSVSDDSGNMKFVIVEGKVVDVAKELTIRTSVIEAVTVKFTEIGLPISNMDIIVAPGAELTVSNNIYKIMPGSSITVETETDDQKNRVEGGKNGILNIGTKVVICNSFNLVFEETSGEQGYTSPLTGTRDNSYTYSVVNSANLEGKNNKGEAYSAIYAAYGNVVKFDVKYKTRTEKIWNGIVYGYNDWSSEKTETVYLTNPRAFIYNAYDEAQFVVDGKLVFNSGAAFAGNITSEVSGAIIEVNADVAGYEIEEGYYIQHSNVGDRWYDLYDPDQHSAAVLIGINGGDAAALKAGTYTYVPSVETSEGSTDSKWNFQSAE